MASWHMSLIMDLASVSLSAPINDMISIVGSLLGQDSPRSISLSATVLCKTSYEQVPSKERRNLSLTRQGSGSDVIRLFALLGIAFNLRRLEVLLEEPITPKDKRSERISCWLDSILSDERLEI